MKQIPWDIEIANERGLFLTRVVPLEKGWEIRMGATCIFVPNEECNVPPQAGEEVKLIGAVGYPIRGIEIGGRCYRYLTQDEEDARHRQWVADYHADLQKKAEDQRVERDAKVAAMPPFFRERIERFRKVNPDFRRDHESYEIFVCEQAILFQETLKTVDALMEFAKAPYEEQKKLVPGLDDNHSGNTFETAVRLAQVSMTSPEILPKMHGALCSLVGCKAYGCFAAHTALLEPWGKGRN